MAKPGPTRALPQRAGLPPPRSSRQGRIGSAPRPPRAPTPPREEQLASEQRRWFEREIRTLQQLAHTERLLGDFVTAQRLERELSAFILEASALVLKERG